MITLDLEDGVRRYGRNVTQIYHTEPLTRIATKTFPGALKD